MVDVLALYVMLVLMGCLGSALTGPGVNEPVLFLVLLLLLLVSLRRVFLLHLLKQTVPGRFSRLCLCMRVEQLCNHVWNLCRRAAMASAAAHGLGAIRSSSCSSSGLTLIQVFLGVLSDMLGQVLPKAGEVFMEMLRALL